MKTERPEADAATQGLVDTVVIEGGRRSAAATWLRRLPGLAEQEAALAPREERPRDAKRSERATTAAPTSVAAEDATDPAATRASMAKTALEVFPAVNSGGRDVNYAFNLTEEQPFDGQPWALVKTGYHRLFHVNRSNAYVYYLKGATPYKTNAYQALESFLEGPTVADCYSVSSAVQLLAVARAMGEQPFNRCYWEYLEGPGRTRPFIKGQPDGSFLGTFTKEIPKAGSGTAAADVARVTTADGTFDVRVGDKAYFRNHEDYKARHPTGAWGGENVICTKVEADPATGKNAALWTGFGMTEKPEADVFRALWEAYCAGDTEPTFERFMADPKGPRLELTLASGNAYRLDETKVAQRKDQHTR